MSENKKVFYAFFILGTGLFILRLPTLFELPGIDQTLFAYVGQKMKEGQLLYRDLWDHKPPGIFFLYNWLSYLGKDLYWIIPLMDTLYTLLTMGALFLLAKKFWDSKVAFGAAFIFALFSLSSLQRAWSRLQPEGLINLMLMVCFYVGYQAVCQQKDWPWIFSGLALGSAFIIKFTALLLALPLLPLLWAAPSPYSFSTNFRLKKLSYLILGWIIPVAVTFIYLYVKGVLPEAYEALVVFNRTYAAFRVELKFVSSLALNYWFPGQIVFYLAVLLLALSGLFRERLYSSLPGQILSLWVLAALFSALIQGKYLWFHFFFLIPPLSLLAGLSWKKFEKQGEKPTSPVWPLLLIILLVAAIGDVSRTYLQAYRPGFASLFKKAGYEQSLRSLPDNAYKSGLMELGKSLARNSQEKDYIYVWALAPEIYYYSGRRAPNRFILHHYLMDSQNPLATRFPGLKARQQELLNDLETKPVKFFLVGRGDTSIFEPKDSLDQLKDFPELDKWLQDNYFLLVQNDRFLLFQRNSLRTNQ